MNVGQLIKFLEFMPKQATIKVLVGSEDVYGLDDACVIHTAGQVAFVGMSDSQGKADVLNNYGS